MNGAAPARGEWQGVYHLHPLRRGDYSFGDLTLRWRGPLGLVVRQARIPAGERVKVYPNLLDVRRYDLLLRRNRLQEMGLRHTRMFGEGTEFERLREYLPDDEFRRINWKATARRGSPVTIEYQTERSQNIIAVHGHRTHDAKPGGRYRQARLRGQCGSVPGLCRHRKGRPGWA